ncbi:PREDICTED: uncharacterized protein LOC104605122 [Nelumbo nucifera]|uniref:Uncharacterized protein LOC104605122 n=2 Tax=Nelumbo nucifera TaxID=4432 RepID=A0A1U8AY93_NELNU|nr:PREDICTED: uncharacterized protein LOC104605122 [Nelumbo nucifera]XP_010268048.1 PREDICTED: uncharacterized protein LOC104605122 [Nelumbo nucifera]XP_010268049.1 PREDICTED: uncharacterized protein LOC104605122 [Nelumbo nucifera]XP_010268050.1 PREDICTED: uncharacterized protein LOC104605122 [Nelumbo nucifera]XP_019054580.1 PREDICTED: uncharacterized protein LOC104605122 [Nelumbo nucifera]DAD33170.1 TPA_asm: hypothetical protein HUJ06_012021 [Nelumbo nucifera]
MGIEKQSSKNGGGYVGGFLQLFDWNGKSRKKLFSNKSDIPERLKQGKKSEGNLPMTWLHLAEDDDIGGGSSIKGSSDYSCASSVTDEEGYGTRAPGVVARLMGLDSLPTSNVADPYSTPFYDARSLRDSHCHKKTLEFHNEHGILHSGDMSNKMGSFCRNPVESRPQKMANRPIERFQTETLPPKSAKSIPITHHKLLSPIKSPGLIPIKNAAHIMEAAAKIIEPGPQLTIRGKMPSLGSTSVPLKVRDFKEKLEAAQRRPSRLPEASQRAVEPNAIKYLKGQSLNKSWNGTEDTPQFRASSDSDENNSSGPKNKGKSISLAIQAKVNVQRREGLVSSNNRVLSSQKEQLDVKSNQKLKNQPNAQRNVQRKSSMQNASGVLRQNNQKQNCRTNKDKVPSKPSGNNQQGRKDLSGDTSFGRNKTLNKAGGHSKAGSRKTSLEATGIEKEVPSSRTNSFRRKKRSINGDFHIEKNGVISTVSVDEDKKPIQSNAARDGHPKWMEDNSRNGMDVVSFTFTSPMIKSIPGSHSSCQIVENSSSSSLDSHSKNLPAEAKSSKLPSLGLNVIGGDALSILLEKKLRELTYGIESSCCNMVKEGTVSSSASMLQDLVSALSAIGTTSREANKVSQLGLHTDNFGSMYDATCSPTDAQMLKMNHSVQGREVVFECSSSNNEMKKELDCRHPSPVSVLEPSFSNESCNSSGSGDSDNSNGNMQSSSVQGQEVVSMTSSRVSQSGESETEFSDSASSTCTETIGGKHVTKLSVPNNTSSTKWELEYVREILSNAELMFRDFTLGRSREIINPHLFDQLESQKTGLRNVREKDFRLRRKIVFDCTSECLDLRCRRYTGGSSRTWAKGVAMVRRKGWLAEEVYKEISGWRSMGDWMVDELVDKDMSSQYGRWLDFDIETFELGVEIEKQILSSLVNEVVADIMLI